MSGNVNDGSPWEFSNPRTNGGRDASALSGFSLAHARIWAIWPAFTPYLASTLVSTGPLQLAAPPPPPAAAVVPAAVVAAALVAAAVVAAADVAPPVVAVVVAAPVPPLLSPPHAAATSPPAVKSAISRRAFLSRFPISGSPFQIGHLFPTPNGQNTS